MWLSTNLAAITACHGRNVIPAPAVSDTDNCKLATDNCFLYNARAGPYPAQSPVRWPFPCLNHSLTIPRTCPCPPGSA